MEVGKYQKFIEESMHLGGSCKGWEITRGINHSSNSWVRGDLWEIDLRIFYESLQEYVPSATMVTESEDIIFYGVGVRENYHTVKEVLGWALSRKPIKRGKISPYDKFRACAIFVALFLKKTSRSLSLSQKEVSHVFGVVSGSGKAWESSLFEAVEYALESSLVGGLYEGITWKLEGILSSSDLLVFQGVEQMILAPETLSLTKKKGGGKTKPLSF
jgi:hypothetical protein